MSGGLPYHILFTMVLAATPAGCGAQDDPEAPIVLPADRSGANAWMTYSFPAAPCGQGDCPPSRIELPPAENNPPPGSAEWPTVHLLYAYASAGRAADGEGCFVISFGQDAAGNPAWTARRAGPAECDRSGLAAGSRIVQQAELDQVAGLPSGTSCHNWGEPAVTAISGALYLAAGCFDDKSIGVEHYVFSTAAPGGTRPTPQPGWSLAAGPFGFRDIGDLAGLPADYPAAEYPNAVGWLDMAVRPDGAVVALFTPEYIDATAGAVTEYACLAAGFNPAAGPKNNPFTTGVAWPGILGTAYDPDAQRSESILEDYGGGFCAYEPASSTRIMIVHPAESTSEPASYEWPSPIETGIVP